jgi:hypothetical protein
MKAKRIQSDPPDAPEALERKLLAELEEMVEGLPPHLFGDVVGTGFDDSRIVVRRRGDVLLPFLILVDTRIN